MKTMLLAQLADTGLCFIGLLAAFGLSAIIIAGGTLFVVARSLFRFGTQRLAFGYIFVVSVAATGVAF